MKIILLRNISIFLIQHMVYQKIFIINVKNKITMMYILAYSVIIIIIYNMICVLVMDKGLLQILIIHKQLFQFQIVRKQVMMELIVFYVIQIILSKM